jgi:hypothetical protein
MTGWTAEGFTSMKHYPATGQTPRHGGNRRTNERAGAMKVFVVLLVVVVGSMVAAPLSALVASSQLSSG